MKKIIMTASVIVTLCLNLFAQKSTAVNADISKSFKEEFKDASNVRWEKISRDIFLVRFNHEQKNSLAYFDKKGELLITGRMVPFNQTPELVQNGVQDMMKSYAEAYGELSIVCTYELNEKGATKYYTNIGNSKLFLAVTSSSKGKTQVIKKSDLGIEGKDVPVLISVR